MVSGQCESKRTKFTLNFAPKKKANVCNQIGVKNNRIQRCQVDGVVQIMIVQDKSKGGGGGRKRQKCKIYLTFLIYQVLVYS